MNVLYIVYLCVAIVAAILSAAIPLVIVLRKATKGKNASDKLLVLKEFVDNLLVDLEKEFYNRDVAEKALSPKLSLGCFKKESALTRVLAKCLELNYKYDEAYWSNYIDTAIGNTKIVNARDKDIVA